MSYRIKTKITETIEKRFQTIMKSYDDKYDNFIIGYSGGLDSSVLVHLCHKYYESKTILFHLNHGISDFSDTWELHCKLTAEDYGLPIYVFNEALNGTSNVEEYARKCRMKHVQSIKDDLSGSSCYLTAHHKNDNVETFLLNLFRGSGIDGLAAMDYHNDISIKPLLDFSKEDLEYYAKTHNLSHVVDESNGISVQDRNFIRNEILPLIKKRWNKADDAINGSTKYIQEAKKYIKDTFTDEEKEAIRHKVVPYSVFWDQTGYKRNILLREWIKKFNKIYPSKALTVAFNLMDIPHLSNIGGVVYTCDKFMISVWKGNMYYIDLPYKVKRIENKREFFTTRKMNHSDIIERPYKKHESIFYNGKLTTSDKLFREENIIPCLRKYYKFYYYKNKLISIGGIYNDDRFEIN